MGFSKQVRVQRTTISPVGCYLEGKEFLGAEYGQFLGICLVGLIIGGLVPIVLYGPAFCGMALCLLARDRGERASFDLLFKGFDYFVPSLIATLIYMGIAFALVIPLMLFVFVLMAMLGSQQGILIAVAVILLVCVYVGWILIIGIASMLFMFAVLLIVDKSLEGPAAMRCALDGVTNNLWGVLASATIGQLILFIGTAMCSVPGLLLIPIVFAGHFIVYRKIFGVEKPVMAQIV
jgi:hypothetical protein